MMIDRKGAVNSTPNEDLREGAQYVPQEVKAKKRTDMKTNWGEQ